MFCPYYRRATIACLYPIPRVEPVSWQWQYYNLHASKALGSLRSITFLFLCFLDSDWWKTFRLRRTNCKYIVKLNAPVKRWFIQISLHDSALYFNAHLRLISPFSAHVREFEIQNPKSGKFFLVESRILGFGYNHRLKKKIAKTLSNFIPNTIPSKTAVVSCSSLEGMSSQCLCYRTFLNQLFHIRVLRPLGK